MKINHYSEVLPTKGFYEFQDCQGTEIIYSVHKTVWGRVTVKSHWARYFYSDPPSTRYSNFIKPKELIYYSDGPHMPEKTESKITWYFYKLTNGTRLSDIRYDEWARPEAVIAY